MRSSARSAVSIDARDSLQPVDHAGRAAMAREGVLQLVVVVEAFWPNAGCTRPVTQTTRGGPITRRGTLPPPPSPSNPLRHLDAAPSNPLRNTAAAARGPHQNKNPRVAREWGSNPHPTTHPPPSTRAHPACRPGLETVGRGEGGSHQAPVCGQRERDLPIPHPGRHNPPCI